MQLTIIGMKCLIFMVVNREKIFCLPGPLSLLPHSAERGYEDPGRPPGSKGCSYQRH